MNILAVTLISILVQYAQTIVQDDETGMVTTNHFFAYSVPLEIGQSKNSKQYNGLDPASLSVSNDIARDVPGLLSWMGTTNFTVTVLMPEGIPQ